MNPIQRIYDKLETVNKQIVDLKTELIMTSMPDNIRNQKELQLKVLEVRVYVNKDKLKRTEEFVKRLLAIKENKITVEKKDDEHYKYFNDNLDIWKFDYSSKCCDWCGKNLNTKTGIVFTIDPLTGEDMTDICEHCHAERMKGNPGGISSEHWESLKSF